MKRFVLLGIVLLAVVCALGATEQQATISPVMEALKFEYVAPPDGKVGGPMEYKVTKDTLKYLTQLKKNKKTIVITSKGEVEIK